MRLVAKSKACVRIESVLSNNLVSMLLIVLRSVRLSLMKNGSWRKKWVTDSMHRPHVMFEVILTHMAQIKSKSFNKFDSFWITSVVARIWRWSYRLKVLFFKCWKFFNPLRPISPVRLIYTWLFCENTPFRTNNNVPVSEY